MSKALLTLLMSLQLMLTPAAPVQTIHTCTPAQPTRLWWGSLSFFPSGQWLPVHP